MGKPFAAAPPQAAVLPQEVRVRPLARSDREVWLRLRSELWPGHPTDSLAREVDSFLHGHGLWRWGNQTLPFEVLVAEHSTAGVVGFVEASLRPFADGCRSSPVGYVEGWYVSPGHRRQGIGGALIRAAERWARANGCSEMASDAHVDNAVSQASHAALGYEEVRRLVHFHRALE